MNSIRPSLIYSTMVWLVAVTLNGIFMIFFDSQLHIDWSIFSQIASVAFISMLVSIPAFLIFFLIVSFLMEYSLKPIKVRVVSAILLGLLMLGYSYSLIFGFDESNNSWDFISVIVLSSVLAPLLIPLNLKWIKYNPNGMDGEE